MTLVICLAMPGWLCGQTTVAANSKPEAAVSVAAITESVSVPASKPHDDSFVIGANDVLAINVWKEPDVSRSVPVRSDGKISLLLSYSC